jgi:hypothetical protein
VPESPASDNPYRERVRMNDIKRAISHALQNQPLQKQIEIINELREHIHDLSPFRNEPVDFVRWVQSDDVVANDYNPNKVAPPEMQLLEVSIVNDGYTQPIVTFPHDGKSEVVDGFHRHRVGKESAVVRQRISGFLPTVAIRKTQSSKSDRIASTIRHNRARGKHMVSAMSEIVLELKNRNWRNERIARELGMDEEEILRLCQISGLEDIFKDDDFSRSWNIEDSEVAPYEALTDEVTEQEREENAFRTVNTNDADRIFHTFDKWECHASGFYSNSPPAGMSSEECESLYATFLSDDKRFRRALKSVLSKWKHSCEHYLTNKSMNRIAWLGQAAMCYDTGVSSKFCGGFYKMTEAQQKKANATAHEFLNKWLQGNRRPTVSFDEAYSSGRQMEIY